jgi:hypothetical protein
MIPIPKSQRLTMIAYERIATLEKQRISKAQFLQEEDYEKDPCVYNHLSTELCAEA